MNHVTMAMAAEAADVVEADLYRALWNERFVQGRDGKAAYAAWETARDAGAFRGNGW